MSFFTKGDFKTREQWLKRQKRANLKKEQEIFNKNIKADPKQTPLSQPKKEKLSQILTLDTQQSQLAQKPPPKHEVPLTSFKNETDAALYLSMQSRLLQQQHLRQKQRAQLAELNHLIQQTKTENAILKAVNQEIPSYQQSEAVKITNKQFVKKFTEMEAYLNSHGAFYEGSTITGEFNVEKVKKDIKEAKTNYRTPSVFEFSAIQQRIQELNQNLMKELGTKRIVNANGINKFKQCEQMKLSFFKNGIRFEGIGFYQYASKDGVKILTDLTDGYYPHIFKKSFPDGVYMELFNKIGDFQPNQKEQSPLNKADWFFGKGHSLDHD